MFFKNIAPIGFFALCLQPVVDAVSPYPLCPVVYAFPVFDAAALQENILQRVLFLEQWARDNLQQIDQLTRLDEGNTVLSGTQNLIDANFVMDEKQSWSDIQRLHQQSLALICASKSAWDEFGSAQQYYAAFQKAQAWELCFEGQHCSFSEVIKNMENSGIDQAMQAYQNAQAMHQRLQTQLIQLQEMDLESQNSTSMAGTIDSLAKIAASTASSMIDLNNQLAHLTEIESHTVAQNNNEQLMDEALFHESMKNQTLPYDKQALSLP